MVSQCPRLVARVRAHPLDHVVQALLEHERRDGRPAVATPQPLGRRAQTKWAPGEARTGLARRLRRWALAIAPCRVFQIWQSFRIGGLLLARFALASGSRHSEELAEVSECSSRARRAVSRRAARTPRRSPPRTSPPHPPLPVLVVVTPRAPPTPPVSPLRARPSCYSRPRRARIPPARSHLRHRIRGSTQLARRQSRRLVTRTSSES